MPTAWKLLRTYGLALLWLVTVVLMALDAASDPFDPTRVATRAYGHNGEGALVGGVVVTTIEALVLHLLLKPWRAGRSWGFPLVALVGLAPWTLLSGILTMHQGGVVVIHLLWLLAVDAAVFTALVVTIVRAIF